MWDDKQNNFGGGEMANNRGQGNGFWGTTKTQNKSAAVTQGQIYYGNRIISALL